MQEVNAQRASLQEQLDALTAEKSGLESSLQQGQEDVAGKQAQIDELNAKLVDVQARFHSVTAAKNETEAQLQASETELASVEQSFAELEKQVQALQGETAVEGFY